MNMNKTILHWSYLNFKDVPMDLFLYEDLEEVYLKENFISVIPQWLLNITSLRFIHLAGNNLTDLPPDIYMLENLEFLDVSDNELTELPTTLGLLLQLQQLNISGNKISELPKELNTLRNLEHLNIAKNKFRRLPLQLSECVRLNELDISENEGLIYLPERIANLPMLQSLSADLCNLMYLPAALSKFMNHVRIFHNTSVNYIPMIYERFYQNFHDNRRQFTPISIPKKGLFWVRELETQKRLLLPVGTRKVFQVPSAENQVTLYDDCLHALQSLNRAVVPLYENEALHRLLPEPYMSAHVNNGPIATCTTKSCSRSLYTTYYLMVVKRRGSSSKQLFTCNFCTVNCAFHWLSGNARKYYQVEWKVSDDDDDDDDKK